jgi:hypothetical protein
MGAYAVASMAVAAYVYRKFAVQSAKRQILDWEKVSRAA